MEFWLAFLQRALTCYLNESDWSMIMPRRFLSVVSFTLTLPILIVVSLFPFAAKIIERYFIFI